MPDRKRKGKPRVSIEVSIIGTGRLGTTLALALAGRGYSIKSLVARRRASARKAASLLNADIPTFTAKEIGSIPPSDLVLISVPDDEIANVATELGGRKAIALHTSGALSAEVLAPLRAKGWTTGSMHPLISVSHPQATIKGAFWSVEGDARAVRLAKTIVRDLEGESFSIRSEAKPLYHAAAVMAAGNVVALFDVALEMLVQCGLTRKTARSILLPLIASTVHNLETKDPEQALTGTFARGDVETIKRHLEALRTNKLADALDLYRLLGKRSLKLAEQEQPQIAQILKSR